MKDKYCLEALDGQEWILKATTSEVEKYFKEWVNLINHRIIYNGKDISRQFKK